MSALHPFEHAVLSLVRFGSPEVPSLSPEEWEPVAQVLGREGLVPLAHAAVRGAAETVPPEVASALAAGYSASAGAAVDRYRQLAAVTAALAAASIPTLVLKGAALARAVYPEQAQRPFTDLDLLVRVEDVDRVHLTLTALGYDIALGPPSEADRTWRHGRGYFDPQRRRVPVDVHWRYAGYPLQIPMNFEGVFTRAAAFPVDGQSPRMPSGADMVVALSIHFLRELWYDKPRLRYLRDIAEVCGRGRVEWARLPEVVEEAPLLASPLYLALMTSRLLVAAPVPSDVTAALRPRRWGALSRMLMRRVTRNIMRAERPVAAVGQVGLMRGLDAGTLPLLRWLWGLVAVPAPLAPSRRRWLRYLSGGPFRGARPAD